MLYRLRGIRPGAGLVMPTAGVHAGAGRLAPSRTSPLTGSWTGSAGEGAIDVCSRPVPTYPAGTTGRGGTGATNTEVCPVGVTVSTACLPSTSVTFCDHPGACFA